MASGKMIEYLSSRWSMLEWMTRAAPYRSAEDIQQAIERADSFREIQVDSHVLSDRELAKKYPEVIEQCVPWGFWNRIKPKE